MGVLDKSQPEITCSKLAIQTLEQSVKYVQSYQKKTPEKDTNTYAGILHCWIVNFWIWYVMKYETS